MKQPIMGNFQGTISATSINIASILNSPSIAPKAFSVDTENRCVLICPASGTFRNLHIRTNGFTTFRLTLRVNGSDSSLVASTSSSQTGFDISNSVNVNSGDLLSFGTSGGCVDLGWGLAFTPSVERENILMGSVNTFELATGNAHGCPLNGCHSTQNGESGEFDYQIAPMGGTLSNLMVFAFGMTGRTINIMKNGATALVSGFGGTATVEEGDRLWVAINSGAVGNGYVSWGVIFTPNLNSGSPLMMVHSSAMDSSSSEFAGVNGSAEFGTTSASVRNECPGNFEFYNLKSAVSYAPGAGTSWKFTVRKNSIAQTLSNFIIGTQNENSNSINTFSANSGDDLEVMVTPSNTPLVFNGTNTLASRVSMVALDNDDVERPIIFHV